jgi:hypothetical protein
MKGTKADYIFSFASMKEAVVEMNAKGESRAIIFLTSFGQVQGEVFYTEHIDLSSTDSIQEGLTRLFEEKKKLDVLSLADSYYYMNARKEREELGVDNPIPEHAIPLKNVQIRHADGSRTNIEAMVLFSDQIVGIIPGVFAD